MRAASWVVTGLVVAGLGYVQAALALVDSPDFLAAWSLVAIGLFLAAVGSREAPEFGALAFVGFLVAGLANLYGIILNPQDPPYLAATGSAMVGAFLAAGVAWKSWREAQTTPGQVTFARVAFGVAGLAGAIYFVFEFADGVYDYLIGDTLAAVGWWLAAWKLGGAARA